MNDLINELMLQRHGQMETTKRIIKNWDKLERTYEPMYIKHWDMTVVRVIFWEDGCNSDCAAAQCVAWFQGSPDSVESIEDATNGLLFDNVAMFGDLQ